MGKILSVNNLSIELKNKKLFQQVSFEINAGDAVLLSGENGIGKSTLIKSILRLEPDGKNIQGDINVDGFGNVLTLAGDDVQTLRSKIAYIQQRDDYSEMGRVQVRDIISDSNEAYSGKKLSHAEVNDLIDYWIPKKDNGRRIFDAKAYPAKFSGGEQRLLSVLAGIATRPNTKLAIIDEPLNNLDFSNVRTISNLLNKVRHDNPQMAILMVSHCRIFPFITREIKLSFEGASEISGSYVCHSCFGDPDKEGFYR